MRTKPIGDIFYNTQETDQLRMLKFAWPGINWQVHECGRIRFFRGVTDQNEGVEIQEVRPGLYEACAITLPDCKRSAQRSISLAPTVTQAVWNLLMRLLSGVAGVIRTRIYFRFFDIMMDVSEFVIDATNRCSWHEVIPFAIEDKSNGYIYVLDLHASCKNKVLHFLAYDQSTDDDAINVQGDGFGQTVQVVRTELEKTKAKSKADAEQAARDLADRMAEIALNWNQRGAPQPHVARAVRQPYPNPQSQSQDISEYGVVYADNFCQSPEPEPTFNPTPPDQAIVDALDRSVSELKAINDTLNKQIAVTQEQNALLVGLLEVQSRSEDALWKIRNHS